MGSKKQENEEVLKRIMGKERSPGEIIRARRRQMHLSQDDLEFISGVSVSTIGRIERNQVKASLENIERLEQVLEIPLRDEIEKYWRKRQKKKADDVPADIPVKDLRREISDRGLTGRDLRRLVDRILSEPESDDSHDSGVGDSCGADEGGE